MSFYETHKNVYLSKDLYDKREPLEAEFPGVSFHLVEGLDDGEFYAVGKDTVIINGVRIVDKRQFLGAK